MAYLNLPTVRGIWGSVTRGIMAIQTILKITPVVSIARLALIFMIVCMYQNIMNIMKNL